MSKVVNRMENVREVSRGTMPLHVVFDTEAEVAEAREWMKGKRKVKTLTPMTREESEQRLAAARDQILGSTKKPAKKRK